MPPSIWPSTASGLIACRRPARRDLDHPHQAQLDVHVDHRPVGGEGEPHVRVALARLGVERMRRRGGGTRASPRSAPSPTSSISEACSRRAALAQPRRAPPRRRLAPRRRSSYVWREADDEPGRADRGVGRQHEHLLDARARCGRSAPAPSPAPGRPRPPRCAPRRAARRRPAQPHPGGRVVVEALGEADVLDADRVADAAPHALAVGGRSRRRRAARAGRRRSARAAASPRTRSSSSAHRRRPVDDLAGGQRRALRDRVAHAAARPGPCPSAAASRSICDS